MVARLNPFSAFVETYQAVFSDSTRRFHYGGRHHPDSGARDGFDRLSKVRGVASRFYRYGLSEPGAWLFQRGYAGVGADMLTDKHVFITGGAGFIGSNLAKRLMGDNAVALFDNFSRNAAQHV